MKNKKKILIVTAFPTHGAGSGALITTQAKSYVEDGHKVTIITGNNRTDFDKLDGVKYHVVPFTSEGENPEVIEGQSPFNYLMFTTHTESTANFWNASLEQIEEYINQFRKAIKEEIDELDPDIIHTQHNWISSSIATEFDKPIALTIHGTDLMGYKKAIEKLSQVNEKIAEIKENANKANNSKLLNAVALIEEIYKKCSSKKEIIDAIKQQLDNKNLNLQKAELMKLIDTYDSKTLYELYMRHAENSARNSQQIIVISEDQKKEFCDLFPQDKDKVVLLENGYDPKTFYVDKNVDKSDVIPEEELDYDNLVLFVGKFADFKGIDALLNSTKLYEQEMSEKGKKVLTLIVGSGALEPKLKEEAEMLKLEHTHFLGRKPHSEIRKLQNLADVSLIPSRSEPFGLVVIEGTACGHPVVATNSGGIPGILNVNQEDISSKTESHKTPLGVLIPPLPDRPKKLDDQGKDNLDKKMTEYMLTEEEDRGEFITNASSELGLQEDALQEYTDSYMRTVRGMSDAVVGIATNQMEFDDAYIADYTKSTYSQDIIRDKILSIFDKSIEIHKKKEIDLR